MNSVTLGAIGLSVVITGAVFPRQEAAAQTAKDIAGTYTLVASTLDEGGKKSDLYGPNPKGMLILANDGRYTIVLLRSDLPKFASNNRTTGTADENKAVVAGTLAHYGTYRVEDGGKSLVLRTEGSTFPNWNGVEQKRALTVTGDELRYTTPMASTGTGSAETVWKRAK